jgi:hypothetical protein
MTPFAISVVEDELLRLARPIVRQVLLSTPGVVALAWVIGVLSHAAIASPAGVVGWACAHLGYQDPVWLHASVSWLQEPVRHAAICWLAVAGGVAAGLSWEYPVYAPPASWMLLLMAVEGIGTKPALGYALAGFAAAAGIGLFVFDHVKQASRYADLLSFSDWCSALLWILRRWLSLLLVPLAICLVVGAKFIGPIITEDEQHTRRLDARPSPPNDIAWRVGAAPLRGRRGGSAERDEA